MNPQDFGYTAPDFKNSDAHKAVIKQVREAFVETTLSKFLAFFAARLSKSCACLSGDHVTIADCALVPTLNRLASGAIDHVPASVLEGHAEVRAFVERFMALPEVKDWYKPKDSSEAK